MNALVHIPWGIVSVAVHNLGPHKGATHTLRKKRLALANHEEWEFPTEDAATGVTKPLFLGPHHGIKETDKP